MPFMTASVRTVSWNEWLCAPYEPRLPLLVLLPENSRAVGRTLDLRRVVVVSIPLAELRERSFELPPRNVEFAILVEDESSRDSALEFLVPSPLKKQQQKPWNVGMVVVMKSTADNEKTTCPNQETSEPEIEDSLTPGTPSKFHPFDRLWQPDPMVQSILLPILLSKLNNASTAPKAELSTCYEIWDLGAGSGRDVCYLAEQLKAHVVDPSVRFRVVAVDQRYRSQQATDTLEHFWSRRNVAQETECRRMDLDNVPALLEAMAEREHAGCSVLCLFAVRYCNMALIQQLVCRSKDNAPLPRPFVFATSHFCRPYVGASWDFDHPKPHHVLGRHDLREMFQSTDDRAKWSIINDEIASDTDHGRTLIQFVAQRLT